MKLIQMPFWRTLITGLAAVMLSLAGCKPALTANAVGHATEASTPQGENRAVVTDSVNYMYDRGVTYTLYDLSTTPPTAIGGSSVYMLASGGAQACCLNLPLAWRPGIKVRVQWTESDTKQIFPGKNVKDLEIPRYERPANVFVVFYPGQEVEVVVSEGEPGHPAWKGRMKETPWENCVAKNGRKPCKAATARLFDTVSYVGFCRSLVDDKEADADSLCASAMNRCMDDYEDKDYCHGILWGVPKK
jgi:hypothetical protein